VLLQGDVLSFEIAAKIGLAGLCCQHDVSKVIEILGLTIAKVLKMQIESSLKAEGSNHWILLVLPW
jgi:hypothetical protein